MTTRIFKAPLEVWRGVRESCSARQQRTRLRLEGRLCLWNTETELEYADLLREQARQGTFSQSLRAWEIGLLLLGGAVYIAASVPTSHLWVATLPRGAAVLVLLPVWPRKRRVRG